MAFPLFIKRVIKHDLRNQFQRKRKEFSLNKKKKTFDKQIIDKLEKLPEFKNAKSIFLYCSKKDEIQTFSIIKEYINKKDIILAKTNAKNHSMQLYHVENLQHLKKGNFNLTEPDTSKCKKAKYNEIDLAVIPGIVFDRTGHRIGFGKGYYDKLLKQIETLKIGLCYEFQLIEGIPALSHDVQVEKIVTEQKTYSFL